MESKTSLVYLTNVPAPYRERMHEILGQDTSISYSVVYCAQLEPNRTWKLEYGNYQKHFLKEKSKTFKHNNLNVWPLLNVLNPDILLITGFNPTMLYGVIWALLRGRKLIVSLDGTYESEKDYSIFHKLVRRVIFPFTKAFVGPSNGSAELFKSYGVKSRKIFKSTLCIDNSRFKSPEIQSREYDIMFSGQFIERKMPGFFVEVANELKKTHPALRILMVGDGRLRQSVLARMDALKLDYVFTGFLDQQSLYSCYPKAKLFLFPTLHDPWGIVANEACASGTPVITCSNAGAADDLVIDGVNGYILPLDVKVWAEQIVKLLSNENLIQQFSDQAVKKVQAYNHFQAAKGILDAVSFTLSKNTLTPSHEI
ncbi:glycosyltransferase family 4 protein [Dyadobacter crusticola]|uniref:glycosyltransferase family 4 protein n=1 Tax=Dyadobacter crusticola TaxID=292407 RepID=UPI00054F2122|nr:glycosyltransferase family 4 protein [Dyadobacter crusticola]